jgi:hypothetical protein
MFRFHQDGTEASDHRFGVVRGKIFPGFFLKKPCRELRKGEMEVSASCFVEDLLGESGRGFRGVGTDGPEDDVELRG